MVDYVILCYHFFKGGWRGCTNMAILQLGTFINQHGRKSPFIFCYFLLSSNSWFIFWLVKCCRKEMPTNFLVFGVHLVPTGPSSMNGPNMVRNGPIIPLLSK